MPVQKSRTYQTQAVVLRHMEYGEADRILTLYSLENGKISAIAKGVRKLKSRKAGHLMPFTQVALFLAKGRNLDVVSQAQAIKTFENIRADLTKTAYAAYVMELADRFSYEEGANPGLYHLLTSTLKRLDEGCPVATVVHFYEVHLLDLLGFKPELMQCVGCGRKIEAEDQFFSARLGGVLCPSCPGKDPGAWHVSMPVLKYLRYFQRSPWGKVANRVMPPEVEAGYKQLVERYFTYLLEYALKTPPFLAAVKSSGLEKPDTPQEV